MKISTGTILATVMAVAANSHAQIVEKKSLNLDGAKKAIAAAVDRCALQETDARL